MNKVTSSYLKKLFVVLLLMSFARAIFVVCNADYFANEKFQDIIFAFVLGIRTDISLVFLLNIPGIIFWFLPAKITDKFLFRSFQNWLFWVVNFIALTPNFIDCAYFRFIARRSGFEIFSIGMFADEDVSVFWHILTDYWYLVLLIILNGIILFKVAFRNYSIPMQYNHSNCNIKNFGRQILKMLIVVAICVFAIRGGWQSKPLKPIDMNALASSIKTSVVANNSTFNIINTRNKIFKNNFNFMSNDEANRIYSFIGVNNSKFHGKFHGKNLFTIILEGFSAEHVSFLDKKYKIFPDRTCTPFLDELSEKSIVFKGFSNGVSSIDALTSILFSVPPMTNTSFVTSAYMDNELICGSSLMKEYGWHSIFFYGGRRNSCRFDAVRKKTQTIDYFCEDEYDGDSSYRNPWGVDDEEFLQFALKKLNQAKQPFFGTLFTLSSHHPFVIPPKYKNKFPKGEHPLMELISYTDFALRKFFEEAIKQDWFKNTLFVISADHINGVTQPYYNAPVGRHSIPIMIYDPSGELKELAGDRSNQIIQQIDIMPTVLDLFGIDDETFMLGKSAFDDDAPHFALTVSGGVYQLIKDGYVLRFDGTKSIGLYSLDDYLLEQNLINKVECKEKTTEMDLFIKAFLQQYHDSLVTNSMTVDRQKAKQLITK